MPKIKKEASARPTPYSSDVESETSPVRRALSEEHLSHFLSSSRSRRRNAVVDPDHTLATSISLPLSLGQLGVTDISASPPISMSQPLADTGRTSNDLHSPHHPSDSHPSNSNASGSSVSQSAPEEGTSSGARGDISIDAQSHCANNKLDYTEGLSDSSPNHSKSRVAENVI